MTLQESLDKQKKSQDRILRIESVLKDAINDVCKEYNNTITTTELNTALIKVLQANTIKELKYHWQLP